MKLFLMIQFLAVLVLSVYAESKQDWQPHTIPHPATDPVACNSKYPVICDPDKYLLDDEVKGIGETISSVSQKHATTIGVLIVSEMHHTNGVSLERQAETFAQAVHEQWNANDVQTQLSVLIFLSIQDKRIYISTSTSDVNIKVIDYTISKMKPLLRSKEYPTGIQVALDILGKAIAGENLPVDASYKLYALIPLCFVFLLLLPKQRYMMYIKETRECKKKIIVLVADKALARSHKYEQHVCPICLESLTREGQRENEVGYVVLPRSTEQTCSEIRMRRSNQEDIEEGGSHQLITWCCGHQFHNDCFSLLCPTLNDCPICKTTKGRLPIAHAETLKAGVAADIPVAEAISDIRHSSFRSEFMFRVSSLQRQYPNILTNEQILDWHRYDIVPFTTNKNFVHTLFEQEVGITKLRSNKGGSKKAYTTTSTATASIFGSGGGDSWGLQGSGDTWGSSHTSISGFSGSGGGW